MIFGAAYYPEHWPEERWPRDIELMLEAGINTVRIGEFAWCRMEPQEGSYNFSWLARVIQCLAEHGIRTILCTPTASPPAWLAKRYPEILPANEQGIVKRFGSRKNYCVNSSIYRDYSVKIITALATEFQDCNSIIAWQIDNEFGNRGSDICYCENCARQFREWLKKKYGTLENLNKCWGTIFWSHEYSDWEEIDPPRFSVTVPDPGIRLDYRRFASDSFVDYQKLQVDLLRQLTPDIPVTHNIMSSFHGIDYYKLGADLDFLSLDLYPNHGGLPAEISMRLDFTRGYKHGKNFIVSEQQCGQKIWAPVNTLLRPGILRLWTYDSISHGANGILYFQWRQGRFGSEKFHSALLTHDGLGDNRIYREAAQVGQELARIGDKISGAIPQAKIAMVFSFDNKWALDNPPSPSIYLSYLPTFRRYYEALYKMNLAVDIVGPGANLSPYSLVIAPMLYLVDQATCDNLYLYVKAGGCLVGTMQTGLADEHDIVTDKPYPGELGELFGIRVHEFDPLSEEMKNRITFIHGPLSGRKYDVEVWCDLIEAKQAETLAVYDEDFYQGWAAVTCNAYGQGRAFYIGTQCQKEFLDDLMLQITGELNLAERIAGPRDVEIKRLAKDGTELIYIMNHHHQSSQVTLDREYTDLLTGQTVSGVQMIPGYEVMILT